MSTYSIRDFLKWESAGGIIMLSAALLAMLLKNSPLNDLYFSFLMTPVQVKVGMLDLDKPLLLWVNDGLMALFFFMIGLELKHEVLVGQMSSLSRVLLPIMAAIGGVVVPALIYVAINYDNKLSLHGWAIPTATDIAFAIALVVILAEKVPRSLKMFLLTLAVLDDLIAVIIIAVFYTPQLSMLSLSVAGICLLALLILNVSGVKSTTPFYIVGILLWVSVLKSGIHGTLAGIVIALFVPLYTADNESGQDTTPKRLIHQINPWVMFGILPLFAFMNAGVDLTSVGISTLLDPVPLGIMLGLFIGKPLGVFLFTWIIVQCRLASLPQDATWSQMFGIALLCGIGFTMSLFIGSLAFQHGGAGADYSDRLGIMIGSTLSAVVGFVWLKFIARQKKVIDLEGTAKL